jgi:hypothetical protein
MRDIWIRKSWLRIATGLVALAIIAAIWINYRLELSRCRRSGWRLKARRDSSDQRITGWLLAALR